MALVIIVAPVNVNKTNRSAITTRSAFEKATNSGKRMLREDNGEKYLMQEECINKTFHVNYFVKKFLIHDFHSRDLIDRIFPIFT